MKAAIGVYDSHEKALSAVKELKDAGYAVKNLSIIGKADVEEVDGKMHVTSKNPLNIAGVGIGTALGTTVGILTGVGLFAIPGFGFLFGAGALIGAIAGFDIGLIGGGIASVLTTVGVSDEAVTKYQQDLTEGRYLVVAQGDEEQVNNALKVLETHGMSTYTSVH